VAGSFAERIAWGALGLLSFIVLIVWLRWEGPWEDQKDQKKDELPEEAEGQRTPTREQSINPR
jgi:hypothetical protein